MTCPLCGLEFEINANTRCTGCLLKKGCEKICCPRCGYETVVESSLVGFAKKLFGKRPAGST
jgi:hypothetical protein